ncbi:MAG: J domain-containing protein [bacterium]
MKFHLSQLKPHIGKLVGGTAGLLLGLKLFGLILGVLLGALADILLQDLRLRRSLRGNTAGSNQPELEFIISLTRKVLRAAALNGPAPRHDVQYLQEQLLHRFHLTPRGESVVRELCKNGPAATPSSDQFAEEAGRHLRSPLELSPEEQLAAARLLFEAATLADSNKRITHKGRQYVQQSCRSLRIRPEFVQVAAKMVIREDTADYEVLGVPPETDTNEIKRVYRTLAAQFHPDSLHGLSSEQQKAATEAFMRIRNAYERIMKER